jgi:hypothetical protein
MFGIASVSYALSLSDLLFTLLAVLIAGLGILMYLRSKKVCNIKGIRENRKALSIVIKSLMLVIQNDFRK